MSYALSARVALTYSFWWRHRSQVSAATWTRKNWRPSPVNRPVCTCSCCTTSRRSRHSNTPSRRELAKVRHVSRHVLRHITEVCTSTHSLFTQFMLKSELFRAHPFSTYMYVESGRVKPFSRYSQLGSKWGLILTGSNSKFHGTTVHSKNRNDTLDTENTIYVISGE